MVGHGQYKKTVDRRSNLNAYNSWVGNVDTCAGILEQSMGLRTEQE
jgi:hypothetical protein